MQLYKLALCMVVGFAFGRLTGLQGLEDASWYTYLVATLLATGLYASTYGIDLDEAKQHLKLIVSAVTIGVVLKAALIGGSLALLFQDPFFFILGVAVAQIDPLSVAALLKGNRMSKKAKTILASWASFDDPITVILSLYVPLLVVHFTSLDLATTSGIAAGWGIPWSFGANLLLAASVLGGWLIISAWKAGKVSRRAVLISASGAYVLLAVAFSLSILYFLMLGIALIGLFLRPTKVAGLLDHAIVGALAVAATLLGILLVPGLDIWRGVALGVAAYAAQIVVGFLLTRGLPGKDRWHISFAQQNGITAIILALFFETIHPGTVAIVAPAIIVINGLHSVANRIVDRYLR